ncbi:choline-sulfatase [Penicillium cinerascens]|uniref:Choline-sulfatase n=1 Tax=Penicillium cinerascens TaxID=70096 RepID=A0A9W9J6Z2_9EURO|nr:choline-sulfatase [Penicillium cinerascens]KAJ5190909.1 choline-sulfatase [Penicillium cinerascens]
MLDPTTIRPNILFIVADDLGAWAVRCAGNHEIHTPNIDKLAAEGVRCDNFFCASPVCSPARASILTGRIPSQHGVHDYIRSGNVNKEKTAIEYLAGQPSYTEILADGGYSCALSGKWHLGNSRVPQKGFNRWFSIARGGCSYKRPDVVVNGDVRFEDGYITNFITENGISFMQEMSQEKKPFYLSVHYTAPHSPWERSEHLEQYLSLYDNCAFTSVPELPIHPCQVDSCPHGEKEERKELLRGYYAAITAMDNGIGQLMQELDRLGIREDTLVAFISDNGMNMGHHGIWGKGNATSPLNVFDTSIKIPAIFRQPGVIPPGGTISDLLSQYDIFPTILEYTGLEPAVQQDLPGTSFVPLLKRKGQLGRKEVVIYDEYGPVRMIRTSDWKYVHRYPHGPHELFDLVNDPGETDNRFDDKGLVQIRDGLRKRLGVWYARYVRPEFDGIYAAVTGFGQKGLAIPGMREGNSFDDKPPAPIPGAPKFF